MESMEEVYFRMHVQLMYSFKRVLSTTNRTRLETMLFVLTVQLLLLTILMHLSFASSYGHAQQCLSDYLPAPSATTSHPANESRLLRIQVDSLTCSLAAFEFPFCLSHIFLQSQILPDYDVPWHIQPDTEPSSTNPRVPYYNDPRTSFVFAAHKGLLALLEHAENMQTEVQMETTYIPSSCPCFQLKWVGQSPTWSLFLENVLGYDTILMNYLARQYGGKGYFYRESVKLVTDLNFGVFQPRSAATSWLLFVSLKFKILHTILFLFFIVTALVAFVLMETQKRMITFTELFQNRSQLQIPFANLVLAYFAQSLMFVPVLVGMLFFLFELYKDHLLAFAVMTIMWIGESFSVISVRCRLSQVYFPPLFFCLFAFFHMYFFSFPLGFSYVAFATMSMFLVYLTVLFTNCLEIPALDHGQISVMMPREHFLLAL